MENIPLLLEAGADIWAYDPVGTDNFRKKYPELIHYVDCPEEALSEAHVCFIYTEWKEIKALKPSLYKSLMKSALVYDGRNLYNKWEMKQAGIEYYSVGR